MAYNRMSLFKAIAAWCKRILNPSVGVSPAVLDIDNKHDFDAGYTDAVRWWPRLELACLMGKTAPFEQAPEGFGAAIAAREKGLLVGPQVFGRRILRTHPNVLLLFVERGWWTKNDLGRFVEQTCYFGSPYFMSGVDGVLKTVPIAIVREWSAIIFAEFELNAERRKLFIAHMVTSMNDATWMEHGHHLCRCHTEGIDMDVLLAVARRTRPDWIALEMHSSLDIGLRSIVWPLVDLQRPTESMFMPQSGGCPELDLLLGVERPFSCDELYSIGVRLKRMAQSPPDVYPVPEGI